MAATLSSLPRANAGYRLGHDTRRSDGEIKFRTVAQERQEDERRATGLERMAAQYPEQERGALDLASRLRKGLARRKAPATLASAVFHRQQRLPLLGHIWELAERCWPGDGALITLNPQGMLREASELSTLDPHSLKKRLCNDLDRSGVTKAKGFVFAGLDAEFDANRGRGVWDFHFHLYACGDKINAIERLRDRDKYANARVHPLEVGLPIMPRVQIKRGLTNLPDPITYCVKSWVPNRPTTQLPDGSLDRSGRKSRIPSPYHEQWLMWIDKRSISDFILLNGMRPGSDGFVLTNP